MSGKKNKKRQLVRDLAKEMCWPLFQEENMKRDTMDLIKTDCLEVAANLLKEHKEQEVKAAAVLMNYAVRSNDFSEIYDEEETQMISAALQRRFIIDLLTGAPPEDKVTE